MFITLNPRAHGAKPTKRARKALACSRCRHRKIKCEFRQGERCSKCLAANVDCVYISHDGNMEAKHKGPSGVKSSSSTTTSESSRVRPSTPQTEGQTRPFSPSFPSFPNLPSPRQFTQLPVPIPPPFDGLALLSEASSQQSSHNISQTGPPARTQDSQIVDETGDETTLSSMFEVNADSTTRPSPFTFHFIGNTNPLSCLLQEQDKTKIVDRTAGYRALIPQRPPRSARPIRDYPGQPINMLDWYGAFAAAGYDMYQLRVLDKSGCFSFPPEDAIASLIATYFEHVHPLYPVIDRPEFEAQLHSQDPAELPPLILLRAVLLMGARFSTHSYVLGHTAGSRRCCDQLYLLAKLLYTADLGFETLAMIQAGLLMSLHWEGLDGSNTALSHLSSAIRLAQGMGCHRPATTRKLKGQPFVAKPSTTSTPRQLALFRRIWWSAVAIDRFTATTEGISTVIDDHDASLLDHLGLADFEFEEPLVHAVSSANVRLAEILCRILRTHYQPAVERRGDSTVKSTANSQRVESRLRLELELSQFPTQLEEDVRLPTQLLPNRKTSQIWAAYLHLHYLAAVILLHRPYIPLSPQIQTIGSSDLSEMSDPLGTSSREACRRASADAVKLLSSLNEIDALRYSWPFSVYAVVSALLISFQDFRASDLEVAMQAAARYDVIIELLRGLASTWWAAAAKYRLSLVIKDGFIRSSQVPIFNTVQLPSFVDDEDSWAVTEAGRQQPQIPLDDSFWESLGMDPSIFGPAGHFNSEL